MRMSVENFPGCCKKLILHTIGPVHGTPIQSEKGFEKAFIRAIVSSRRSNIESDWRAAAPDYIGPWSETWRLICRMPGSIDIVAVLSIGQMGREKVFLENLGFEITHNDRNENQTYHADLQKVIGVLSSRHYPTEELFNFIGRRVGQQRIKSMFGTDGDGWAYYLENYTTSQTEYERGLIYAKFKMFKNGHQPRHMSWIFNDQKWNEFTRELGE